MPPFSATWLHLSTSSRLQRSSQALSIVSSKAYVFAGELQPRQPVDNQLDVVDIGDTKGKCQSIESDFDD